jgi:hypothetical protein
VLLAQDPNRNHDQEQDQQMPEEHEEQEEQEQEDQEDQEDRDEAEHFGEDETIRLAAPIHVEATNIALAPQRLEQTDEDFAPTATGAGTESSGPQELGAATVEGVQIGLEDVRAAVNKIWSTLGEMMRQGVPDGQVVEPTVESTV